MYLHFDLVVEEPSKRLSVFHRRGMCTRLHALDESCQGVYVNIRFTNVTWQRLKSMLVLVNAFLELLVVLLTYLHKN